VSVAIVIPVRNGEGLIADCLAGVIAQAEPLGAQIVIVDDASTDSTAEVARGVGVTVISLDQPGGPYVARNAGWRAVEAELVVFTDMRCRPGPDWLAAMVEPFADEAVAIVGGDVETLSGPTTAMRWAAQQQALRLAQHYEHAYYLPAVTTAAMAVRRSALDAVDGFAAIRSGGDVDLCWRVQESGLGRVAPAYDATMQMTPRESAREVVRQWHRFAYGHLELSLRHPERGAPERPATRRAQLGAIARGAAAVVFRPRGSRRVRALEVARLAAYHRSYARVWHEWQRRGTAE
jgi:cellulose synthase/poly-beta-1,6-N-acetylglucosamine synthase-like glycosyltransferase